MPLGGVSSGFSRKQTSKTQVCTEMVYFEVSAKE